MKKPAFQKAYKSAIGSLSFSAELRKMRRELNAKIDMPDTIISAPTSHARGVNRWFTRRRISIAESYLMVVSDLDSRHSRSRLDALRVLVDASFHSKSLDLPLNTARVQMALMKEAVKNRQNKRRQLELLHDFSISTHGQKQVIQRLCDELNIVVLPENGTRLEDFGYGWDDHVHDTATSGRKNPTQLIIDAFIKGISELTVAYGSPSDIEMMEEVLEAGRIIGIRINIGFEFSMTVQGRRFHFMAILPRTRTPADARAFFQTNADSLRGFFADLEKNQNHRVEAVRGVLQEFNASSLEGLNRGFPDEPLYSVPELTFEALNAFIPTMSINRIHLAEFLYSALRPVMFNRLLLLKVRRSKAQDDWKRKRGPESEYRAAEEAYSSLKKAFKSMSPDSLLARYFDGPSLIDYQSAFDDIAAVKSMLSTAGCGLKILHPLEHGVEKAIEVLTEYRGVIDLVELYNIQDCIGRGQEEILSFAREVNALNERALKDGIAPYIPVCGSDSTGRHPKIPGMGFAREDKILGSRKGNFLSRHIALPPFISAMIGSEGKPVRESDASAASPIVCLGKLSEWSGAGDSSSTDGAYISPRKVWRYLNPSLKNYLYTVIGFIVANHFIGWAYALLWLGITGFRNSVADLVSNRGGRLSEWKLKSINFDNVAQSLFWTGFSVPILGFVKSNFDIVWPWAQDGMFFNLAKFFVISFANGLYLAAHNTLRGFDKKVVRANFFRSVIAWPFAAVFAPLGNLMRIPSIVQTKIWSDFVAGFIEGGGKYMNILRLRKQNIEEIIPKILEKDGEEKCIAILDLLYLFREEPRTRNSLISLFELSKSPVSALWSGKGVTPARPLGDLLSALDQPGLDEELAGFILSRYDEEMTTDLVGLVAETLPPFRTWLDSRVH
ncbi:MAG TPA: hypothetical protein VN445_06005 [Rectinemataceae bacterium]|nr:hypothetical protein [Rectinemataceae bacterium]